MAAKNDSVSFSFNRRVFTFTKAQLQKKANAGVKASAPRDASNLKHQVKLPGVKVPVSVQWVAKHLLDTDAIGESRNGKPKGAYHPAQVLSAMTHLQPLGVKVTSTAESARYAAWSPNGKKTLDAIMAQKKKADAKKVPAKKTARKTIRK